MTKKEFIDVVNLNNNYGIRKAMFSVVNITHLQLYQVKNIYDKYKGDNVNIGKEIYIHISLFCHKKFRDNIKNYKLL